MNRLTLQLYFICCRRVQLKRQIYYYPSFHSCALLILYIIALIFRLRLTFIANVCTVHYNKMRRT